jgi:hypothetical protein
VAIGHGLGDQGIVEFPLGERFFSFWNIQTASGAPPASCWVSSKSSFLGVKWAGPDTDHLSPPTAKVKNVWNYTSTPPYALMMWCLLNQAYIGWIIWWHCVTCCCH